MKKNNNLFCFIKKNLSQPHSNQEEQTNEGDTGLYHSRPNRHGRAVRDGVAGRRSEFIISLPDKTN